MINVSLMLTLRPFQVLNETLKTIDEILFSRRSISEIQSPLNFKDEAGTIDSIRPRPFPLMNAACQKPYRQTTIFNTKIYVKGCNINLMQNPLFPILSHSEIKIGKLSINHLTERVYSA